MSLHDQLHPAFEDLLEDLPVHAPADPDRAWAVGRRRRVRARAGTAAVVAVVVGGAVLSALGLPRPGTDTSVGPASVRPSVDGHPARVDRPHHVDALAERPGPQAGVLETADGSAYLISADGQASLLPADDQGSAVPATLSDDGTRLGLLIDGHYTLEDLVSGRRIVFPVSDGVGGDLFATPAPSFWSPDGSRLLLGAGSGSAPHAAALLLGVDGSLVRLPEPAEGSWHLAGWVDDDTLAWVGLDPRARDGVSMLLTPLGDGAQHRFRLHGMGVLMRTVGPWTAQVSPDGATLVLRTGPGVGSGSHILERFSTATGRFDDFAFDLSGDSDHCSLSWGRDGALTSSSGNLADTASVVFVSSRWHASCTVFAADALAGPTHRSLTARLFGQSDWFAVWWWRQELAALLVILGGLGALIVRRRSSRLEQPLSGAPAPASS